MSKTKLLSIDGGGIRGVVALQCMKRAGINSIDDVDAVACNSAGAIIGCALAAGLTVDEILSLFKLQSSQIFKVNRKIKSRLCLAPKYDIKNLEKCLKKYFYNNQLSDSRKPIFVTSTKLNYKDETSHTAQHVPVVMTNDNEYKTLSLVQAACASAAAPTYFQEYKIGSSYYVDGGMHSNNPSVVGIGELDRLGVESNEIELISFGTGAYDAKKWPRNAGAVQLAVPIIKLFLQGSEEMHEMIAGKLVEGNMTRYQPPLSRDYGLGDWKSIEDMIIDADNYMDERLK